MDEIRAFIGSDSLGYVSLNGLLSSVDHPNDFCTGCFTGRYPVSIADVHLKNALEAPAGSPV